MLQAFFNGLSGMLTFSRGLDSISNNIANMNTPGYRGSEVFYRSVLGPDNSGIGSQIAGDSLRLESGDINQTNNATDLAINGQGYFILQDGDTQYYTRGGAFEFNSDGILVDRATGYQVMGITEAGELINMDISELAVYPPEPTTQLNFSGNLAPEQEDSYQTQNAFYINSRGEEIELVFEFTYRDLNTGSSTLQTWEYTVSTTGDNAQIIAFGTMDFINGSISGFDNEEQITIPADANGTAEEEQVLTLSFGDGVFREITNNSGTSNVTVSLEDGVAAGGLLNSFFTPEGVIRLEYSNGQTQDGAQLALVYSSSGKDLEQAEGNLFTAKNSATLQFGRPGEDIFGDVLGSFIELSNVDMAREFADMIIIQRGYQASSRVLSIANELVEQLYSNTGGRG
ncbi:MAG: flagellar basal-body rod protein FlgF [Pseudomonadota bacterium]